MISPIEKESSNYLSYVVLSKETGVYEKPEMMIEMNDPYNKTYLMPYIKNKSLGVQVRETHVFKNLSANEALFIGRKYVDCMFRFLEDYDSVTYQSNEYLCESIEWAESHPDESASQGSYSFFMDRLLSSEEQNIILMELGFSRKDLGI